MDALPDTKADHARKIQLWFRWLSAHGVDPRDPSRGDVLRYKQDLLSQKKSLFTVNGYVAVVKVFYKFCEEKKYCDNIAAGIKTAFKKDEYYKLPLTRKECAQLLRSIDRNTMTGLRDYLMIQLMLTNGLRCCEVARINVGDFETINGKNVLHIQRKGRVDKHDVVAVPDEVMESVRVFLDNREDELTLETPLFVSLMRGQECKRLPKPTISGIIKKRLRAIGINDPKISAHSLRHTCGSLMVEQGLPIETIQDMLGHNDPATTQIYINMARKRRLLEHSPSTMIAKIIAGKKV